MLLNLVRTLALGGFIGGYSTASAEPYQVTTEHWSVQLGEGERKCYAASVSPSSGLILHSNRDQDGLFILGDDAVRELDRGKSYPGKLNIDGSTWTLSAFVAPGDIDFGKFRLAALVWGDLPRRFLDEMRSGRVLTGAVGGIPLEAYSLKGSRQALDYLDECLSLLP